MSIFTGKPTRRAENKPSGQSAALTQPYVMSTGKDGVPEIELYGDIVSARPTDWNGEPIDGRFIILSDFLEDLKQVEDSKKIRVRIHSAGGNAYDAMAIHNRLKSLAAEIEVVVDGVAMSGGSLIMCAASPGKTKVFPGSLVMIHCCWAWMFGGYNSAELHRIIDSNDAVDRSQAAIYSTKTGISHDEIMSMMEQECYMTGKEAVEKGFADELVEDSALEIAASADRKTLFVHGTPVWISGRKDGIPAGIPSVATGAIAPVESNINTPATAEGGTKHMANTIEELRAEYPDLVKQLEEKATQAATTADAMTAGEISKAAQAEQKRIKEIDDMAALFDDEIVNAAKYGKDACTAQEMAYRAAQKAAKEGKKFISDLKKDFRESGAESVSVAPCADDETSNVNKSPEQQMAAARMEVRNLIKDQKEG